MGGTAMMICKEILYFLLAFVQGADTNTFINNTLHLYKPYIGMFMVIVMFVVFTGMTISGMVDYERDSI